MTTDFPRWRTAQPTDGGTEGGLTIRGSTFQGDYDGSRSTTSNVTFDSATEARAAAMAALGDGKGSGCRDLYDLTRLNGRDTAGLQSSG